MKDCLVTKLLVEANNSNLPIFEPLEEVAGIKISNASQYVDLSNLVGTIRLDKLKIEIEFTVLSAISSSSYRSFMLGGRGNTIYLQLRETNAVETIKTASDGSLVDNIFTVGTKNKMVIYRGGENAHKAIFNNTEYYWSYTDSNSPLEYAALFAAYSGDTPGAAAKVDAMVLHSIKFYNADESLINPAVDIIPCKDSLGNGVLYDKISGDKLYANTGNLVAVE